MIRSEFRKLFLQSGTLLATLSFFALSLFAVSLSFGSDEKLLRASAPALFWVLAILTTFFSTPLFLKSEAQEGLLDEVLLHPSLPGFYLLGKVMAESILFGFSLILLSIILSPLFSLSAEDVGMLSLTLLIGFPALSALGILGGLLTFQARGGGLLLSFLILPLTLPLLLFSLSVMEMERLSLDPFSSFCLLISTSLFLVILSIGAGSWAFFSVVEG